MRVVHEAVQDRVGVGGIIDDLMPCELPRICRRLQLLRDWGHGNEEDIEELFT
jgi:hypothetical protein